MRVQNPIICGFNPDPSLLRVDDDYYIATSTFEWFPGVCIHHSKDMVNWEIIAYALTDDTRVNMMGIDAACGIWAPNLTYADGLFYLAYTIVYTNRPRYKDTFNYLITASCVQGPWSEPVALNRSGFDPSIFHDTDGKKYVVNMTLDHRADSVRFSGIDVQEYDVVSKTLIGEPQRVFRGTRLGTTEGPNIFKKDNYYYLVLAEGGTEFFHCATVVRSKSVWGPYEENPCNPLITSEGQKDCTLARCGHAQVIQCADGNWIMAHLCSRPVDGYSILGRESAMQNVVWTEDGWFKLKDNDHAKPEDSFEVSAQTTQLTNRSQYVDFSDGLIPLDYMTLRQSLKACGIRVEGSALVIDGGCSPMSKYPQGFLARRQQAFHCDFTAQILFVPRHLNHLAGMLVYYNYDNYYYLKMSRDGKGAFVCVSSVVNRELTDTQPVYLPEGTESVFLRACIREKVLQFHFSEDGTQYQLVGGPLDMRTISDEHVEGNGFTGSMLGVNCCDCQGDGIKARCTFLNYRELYGKEADDVSAGL